MGLKSFLGKLFAKYVVRQQQKWSMHPVETQQAVFKQLIKKAQQTSFGKDHAFAQIQTHADFVKHVPVQDYEGLKSYLQRVVDGEQHVLWPGKPLYFAKTSGTTSGVKYIPITKDSIPYHINSARNALLNYVHHSGNTDFINRKMIFLSGSPEITKKNGIYVGRLSGIVNHHVPQYLRGNQLPTYATNCMDDWEEKLDQIVEETLNQDMSLISGIPPWVQMYFDRIQARTNKTIAEVFPHFSLFVYGGVNFSPYKAKLFESIGKHVDSVETYPASEGFIAFQDQLQSSELLLLLNNGIFYEFIPVEEYFNENPTRLTVAEVELNKNYALVMSTNAGLWAYSIGDTVKFTSLYPHRIVVTGRIKHFISAFGEHVIGEEVEKAMQAALVLNSEASVTEFTVAPWVSNNENLSYHEWFIEFNQKPNNIEKFTRDLNQAMVNENIYYQDLIIGNILAPLKVKQMQEGAFVNYMKSQGKLGGQNKLPRLSNDRQIADQLKIYELNEAQCIKEI
jgi:hypothetical protein